MSATLTACYEALGLRTAPFAITPDTSLFFPGGPHLGAYHQLRYASESGVIAVVSGEVGLGKTLLCRSLIRNMSARVTAAYVLNPLVGPAELLAEIYSDFTNAGEHPDIRQGPGTVAILYRMIVQHVLSEARAGQRFVVVVDEAHRLSADALEVLRLLSNLETERQRLIALVLSGQPELERTLALRSMRPLRERVGVWVRLRPFDVEECTQYVRYRLARCSAGGRPEFSSLALRWLHWATGGVPRRINLACDRALLLAYAHSSPDVGLSLMRRAGRELSGAWT